MSADMAVTHDPPIPIRAGCRHCGARLAIAGRKRQSWEISGLAPLVFVHAENGETECPPRDPTRAAPYDGFRATYEYDQARKEARNADNGEPA